MHSAGGIICVLQTQFYSYCRETVFSKIGHENSLGPLDLLLPEVTGPIPKQLVPDQQTGTYLNTCYPFVFVSRALT